MLNHIQDITNIFYINLESRPDRKKHVESQFACLNINTLHGNLENKNLENVIQRFNAIVPTNGNGALGCTQSHLACLKMALKNQWSHVMIVEDDITFITPSNFVVQLNAFLQNHKDWDVLLIGGNNQPPFRPIDDTCIQVYKCQTTTGYIVKQHYYTTLIQNIEQGMQKLSRYPHFHSLFAIDKHWFTLQRKDRWFFLLNGQVVQREDYSNIEQKRVNYIKTMLDVTKSQCFT